MPYEDEYAHYKPVKRIAENPQVLALLGRARYQADSRAEDLPVLIASTEMKRSGWVPDFVLAVDGSNSEVAVKNGYPSAAIGYVTVASVLLDVAKMIQLDTKRPVDPKVFRTIEDAESIDAALPSTNVIIDDEVDAKASFRRALFELFSSRKMSDEGEALVETYEALLAYKGTDNQQCPCEDCLLSTRAFQRDNGIYMCHCLRAHALYSTDALRIHEFMNPEGSNVSMLTETMNVLERIWIIHILRTFEQEGLLPVLQRMAIVLDGPLAVFGAPAWLSDAIRQELQRLNRAVRLAVGDNNFNLLLFGVEKTGAFVDHLTELDKGPVGQGDALPRQSAMLLTDEYIKRRIIFSNSDRDYGRNTYFGRKAFYKTQSGALVVCTLPFLSENHRDLKHATPDQYPRLVDAMELLDKLVSARYRNAITPLISAHAEAAIPMNIGKRVLERLARKLMKQQAGTGA